MYTFQTAHSVSLSACVYVNMWRYKKALIYAQVSSLCLIIKRLFAELLFWISHVTFSMKNYSEVGGFPEPHLSLYKRPEQYQSLSSILADALFAAHRSAAILRFEPTTLSELQPTSPTMPHDFLHPVPINPSAHAPDWLGGLTTLDADWCREMDLKVRLLTVLSRFLKIQESVQEQTQGSFRSSLQTKGAGLLYCSQHLLVEHGERGVRRQVETIKTRVSPVETIPHNS